MSLFIASIVAAPSLSAETVSDELEQSSETTYLSTAEVAAMYSVNTSTVTSWHHKKGLPARKRQSVGGGREYLLSDVQHFAIEHGIEARKEKAKQIGIVNYRTETIERIHQLLTDDKSLLLSEAMRTVSCERDLCISTLEKWLRVYREQDSNDKLEIRSSNITQETKDDIYRDFCEGTDYTVLASRYSLTRQSIIDLLCKRRALRLSDKEIEYVHHPDFVKKNAYKNIIVSRKKPKSTWKQTENPPEGMPPYLAVLYTIPQLNKSEEQYYFCRMNYFYHRATEHKDGVVQTPTGGNKTPYYIEQAEKIKRMLIRCNLRLVVSIAKKFKRRNSASFEELYGDGCMGLVEAVSKFDFSKDFKLSTYATWKIHGAILQGIKDRKRQSRDTTQLKDEGWSQQQANDVSLERENIDHEKQSALAEKMLVLISDKRDRIMMMQKAGLHESPESMTNQEIGDYHGVSKSRVGIILARVAQEVQDRALNLHHSIREEIDDANIRLKPIAL